jgi:cbb3-type cytochrome oxidase maturation protein
MMILRIWILYTITGVSIFSFLFLWAVRTRQFSDPKRAARLPLHGLDTKDYEDPS